MSRCDAKRAAAAVVAAVLVSLRAGADLCDEGLAISDTDPLHGAAAIGLCTISDGSSPGLLSAAYGNSDFSSSLASLTNGVNGVGLLASFGPNVVPQDGARMLALSSGTARSASDPGYSQPSLGYSKGFSSPAPPGFPAEAGICAAPATTVYDSAALRVVLVAPAWANSYRFDFKYYTTDYPNFVCSAYNDQLLVLASPAPTGSLNGDIAFDADDEPITVNAADFVTECGPGGTFGCPLGAAELAGTGFEGGAATPWLRTTAPVAGGDTVTLTFLIYDSGDSTFDSTALIDAFAWSDSHVAGPSTQIAPEPDGTDAAAFALFALVLAERRRRARPLPSCQPSQSKDKEIRTP
jgi:hypothetical protein